MSVVIFDADSTRRDRLAAVLREQGHVVGKHPGLDDGVPTSVEVAVLLGPPAVRISQRLREQGAACWILALVPEGDVDAVLDAGADDCLEQPASLEQIELRIRVARRQLAPVAEGAQRGVIAALRASEASLRSMLSASPDGIMVHRDARIVFANPAALEQLGFASVDEAIGESVYDVVTADEIEVIRGRLDDMATSDKGAPPRDFQFRRSDGSVYVGEAASIRASFEGAPAVITIIRDVSEQRRLQSRLFLADRLATIGTLTVGVAHEINNPLAWVVGNLGLLADEFDNQVRMRELPNYDAAAVAASRARVRELLGRAQEGTERVRRIVRDLGRFGRSSEGSDEVFDVHALLESTIEIADVQIRHRARVRRDFQAPSYARGSEARLGQVFLNLLVNAGQAIEAGNPRHNEVAILTRQLDDGRIEVAVTDTGVGMPESIRSRVFEPFFTTKPVGEGTGIGLAISHDIVVSMGGEILVESEPGQGSTFRVRLVAAGEGYPSESQVSQVVVSDASISREGGSGIRVLVVDDEPMIREMVCDALAAHEVTAVANGRDALDEIMARDWDLILCDMVLPELSGLDVYRELEQRKPEVLDKLVFMTGGDFSRKAPRLPSGARVRQLDKPFSLKQLRALAARAG